eukprot:Seg1183.1 transcript_id=Seg1183.1/GoldUCD/mRNA.D3Y31 product="N-alpha-acetyltransferase 15 NatA auxiliary subunit" protein_id=Seg1183.1/GoldUCD/D3Y31
MPNDLPPKENTLFKRVLRCYEQKQYKNGLKFCKQILSNPKFEEHGETLAMKGLTLNCLSRKEEAYNYVRRGLRNDLKSHVCWHVYGLLQRSDRKYDEAIKCYRNALKWDKDNIQILRDLSLLQIQMRDLEGFRDTRYQLLKLRPAQRQSWIGYSISYFLLGSYDMAFSIMEEFRKTQYQENQVKSAHDFEHSEMLLYQNMILRESNKKAEARKQLIEYSTFITDKLQVKELQATLHMELNEMKEAEDIYRGLLKRNPENWMYYRKIEECLRLESEADKMSLYQEYHKRYPHTEAPTRLPLNFTTGEAFKSLADEYLQKALRKGVPSLFVNMRGLYGDKKKVEILENMLASYEKNLETQQSFHDDGEIKEDPSVLLWTYFFIAQHHDQLRKTDLALKYVDKVLQHTPTLIEGYMVKAKIYKHAGCIDEALRWIDEGRTLDTADRYVNSKCAKYLLRANQVKKAEEICGLFTREGASPADNLDEMQCMWFQTECALAHKRTCNIGEALKKCHQIDRNFSEIIEDQFDFHTYCMRKVTLNAYIKLLRLEDVLRSHPFYFRAAKIAIELYIGLHDKPYEESDKDDNLNKGNLSAKELKKLKSKQRRAEKKAQQEEDKKGTDLKDSKEGDKKEEKKERFDAKALAKNEKPLEEAIKFLTHLQLLAKDRIETHLMAYEIYERKGKPLLMLQSIKRAYALDSDHPKLHECIVRFAKTIADTRSNLSQTVTAVLDRGMPKFLVNVDLPSYNMAYFEKHSTSLVCRIHVAKMIYYLDNSKKAAAVKMMTEMPDNLEDRTLENCIMAYETIENGSLGESSLLLMEFKQSCHRMFPFATIFQCSENSIDQSPTCNHNNIEATEKLSNGPTTEKITDGVDSVDDIME